jgi:lipoprotein LpqH
MRRPIAAAAAALAATVLGACSPPPQTPLSATASVTVNGNDAKFNVVKCTQVQWYRTIHIGGDHAGATVVVDGRAERAIAESVQIQNVGGFTGMYSQGGGGDANMSLSGGKFTITGTANGYKVDKSSEPTTATFKITATC